MAEIEKPKGKGGRPPGSPESKEVTGSYRCNRCGYFVSYTGPKRLVRASLISTAQIHFKTCPNNPMNQKHI